MRWTWNLGLFGDKEVSLKKKDFVFTTQVVIDEQIYSVNGQQEIREYCK
jgi:hypothetical protein